MFRRSSFRPEDNNVNVNTPINFIRSTESCKGEGVPVYGGKDFYLSPREAQDVDNYLRILEKKKQMEPDFLRGRAVEPRMRELLVDWVLNVCAVQIKCSQEAWTLTINLTDRCCVLMDVNKSNYQLIAVTCLYIALKYEEVVVPHIKDIAYFGGRQCTSENVLATELQVLKALKFNLHFAYPCHFLRKLRAFAQLPSDDTKKVYALAQLFADCGMIVYHTSQWLPSELAVGSYSLSCFVLGVTFNDYLFKASNKTAAEIEKLAVGVAAAVMRVRKSGQCKSVAQKYRNSSIIHNYNNIQQTLIKFMEKSKPALSSTIC
ncbi:unnamed protein product [Bursaphelenchus xylophilus]|nr:unnamed protein product [Bursaphelenchus xylophilus]CAG9086236.1 unnamed protein product [Bursaphelenchus xylophilus]